MADEVFLAVVSARLTAAAGADTARAAEQLASAFMDDDRTATVWIHADGRTSRVALDIPAASWEDATGVAEQLVLSVAQAAGATAEIISIGRPAGSSILGDGGGPAG